MIEVNASQARRIREFVASGMDPDEAVRKVTQAKTPTVKAQATVGETPKRSKYGNVKTEVDGITFDSKKEAARYQVLKERAARGEIERLTVQPRYPLHAMRTKSNTFVEIGSYLADFSYVVVATGETVVEDTKSPATAKKELYRWKKRHVESQYGITVVEVMDANA